MSMNVVCVCVMSCFTCVSHVTGVSYSLSGHVRWSPNWTGGSRWLEWDHRNVNFLAFHRKFWRSWTFSGSLNLSHLRFQCTQTSSLISQAHHWMTLIPRTKEPHIATFTELLLSGSCFCRRILRNNHIRIRPKWNTLLKNDPLCHYISIHNPRWEILLGIQWQEDTAPFGNLVCCSFDEKGWGCCDVFFRPI